MTDWGLDGKPRTARRYTTYQNCPLPTPEVRLLSILVSLKTYPLQVVQGRLFVMGQSKAHQWIHALFVVLRATLRTLGEGPTRSLMELATGLGVAETEGAATVEPPADLATMGPNGTSSAPRIRLSRRAIIAARKKIRRWKTCC